MFSHAGSIFDMTQSYDVSFYLGGIFLFVAAVLGFLVPSVQRLTIRLRKQAETSNLSNSISISPFHLATFECIWAQLPYDLLQIIWL